MLPPPTAPKASPSKLILLEGIPGTGKSSAAEFVQRRLKRQGFEPRYWPEGHLDHPADFEGVAALTTAGYAALLARFPDHCGLIESCTTERGPDRLIAYRKLQLRHPGLPEALLQELSRHDVYDGLPAADYCRLALDRWRDFVALAQPQTQPTILECCFLQNPLTVLLARHNWPASQAQPHLHALAAIVQPLEPRLIYLSTHNVRATLEHVRRERPQAWSDFVTWYLTGQAYGQARQLSGFEGVIQFYTMRQALELDLLKTLPVAASIFDTTDHDWEMLYAKIAAVVTA